MLSFNSIKYYNILITQLNRIGEHISFIENSNPIQEKRNILQKILKSDIGASSSTSFAYIVKREINGGNEVLLNQYMKKFQKFKSDFNLIEYYGLLREISVAFNNLSKKYNFCDECYNNLLEHLNNLAKMYQSVFQSDDRDNIVLFFEEAEKVCFEYQSIRNSLLNFTKSLEDNIEIIYDSNDVFELQLLDINFSVGEFGETLSYIEESYNALKRLVKDEDIANLQIIKIESGSLMAKLKGNSQIIELLTSIMRTIAKELYQKFTINGQLEKQSNIMNMISNAADIIDKFDKMGINTGKSKSDLKDSLNITTNNIYKILAKSGKIMLNDELISIGDEQKLLDYKALYLKDSSTSENDNQD